MSALSSTPHSALTRAHARRLRDLYRSAGWPSQDALEIDLLAAGLLERQRAPGGHETLRFPQGHGDLIVMGGSCQRTWEHAIPKTAKPVGPRVSVQFRPINVA